MKQLKIHYLSHIINRIQALFLPLNLNSIYRFFTNKFTKCTEIWILFGNNFVDIEKWEESLVVMVLLFIAQTTVTAGMCTRLVLKSKFCELETRKSKLIEIILILEDSQLLYNFIFFVNKTHQIYVYFGMSQMLVSSITKHNSIRALNYRLFSNQINCKIFVNIFCGIRKSNISVVILVVGLKQIN